MEEKVTTDGEGLRALGIVLFVISSLGMIVVVFFFQNVTALQIMLALWIISGIMYFSPYFIPTDYHRVNFDYFGTKIHNAFAGEWHSKVIDMPEYLCIEYSTVGRSNYERYTYQKRLSSNTIGVYEGTKSANDFFDVYYYGFNSEEDRISRQKAILQTFKDKEGSIKHYSSENVLIVFRCFSIGSHMSSAYPYIKWLVTRKAVKNVELESSEMRKSLDTRFRTSKGNGKPDDLSKAKISFDEDVLKDIVNNSSDNRACKLALEKISDENFIDHTAFNHPDVEIALEALERIDDEFNLGEMALKGGYPQTRNRAFEKIKNKEFVSELKRKRDLYLTCEECGGEYTIVDGGFDSRDPTLIEVKCDDCGHSKVMSQDLIDK